MPINHNSRLPVYTGKEEDVLSLIRMDFESYAYPLFDGIERERVGSSKDGEYIHRLVSPSTGLNYAGLLKLSGYNCKWFFSTRFRYESNSDDKSWTCYVVFFQNSTAVFTSHAFRRFNERVLYNRELSVDTIFLKHVLPQLEYSRTGIDRNKENALFMRVDEGAFLSYTFLDDGNYWFKTFICDDQMFQTQEKLSDALDKIRYFEMDLGVSITTIFQPSVKEKIEAWELYSEENCRRYVSVVKAVRYVLLKASDDMLDSDDRAFLDCISEELLRITA